MHQIILKKNEQTSVNVLFREHNMRRFLFVIISLLSLVIVKAQEPNSGVCKIRSRKCFYCSSDRYPLFLSCKKYGERHGAGSGKRLDTVYNQLLLNPFFHVKMGAGIAMTFPEQFKG